MSQDQWDVIVIGGGMAGASAAYEMAADRRVLLVERESQPGYHTTGRSAALYEPTYGNRTIRAITLASRGFLTAPPDGFASHALMTPRGVLVVGAAGDEASLANHYDACRPLSETIRRVTSAEALALVPIIRPETAAAGGVYEPAAMDMDVHALHRGYLSGLTRRGGTVRTTAEVTALQHRAGLWEVRLGTETVSAPVVVNAAGAWADQIAALAGVLPIGLVPKRRTAITFDPPTGLAIDPWPMVVDAHETWYIKADAGRLLASPADATPSVPCDAQPEELDIATVIDRLEQATTLTVRRLVSRWAGLRSFVADNTPVVGFEPGSDGFFWLAGQGGYGIQTAPAMGRIAAALSSGAAMPSDLQALAVSEADLAPQRLARTVATLH